MGENALISFDAHTHSQYSFDTENDYTVEDMCNAALMNGLTHIAITDHYDVNAVAEGIYPCPDIDSRDQEICTVREKFKNRLFISRGIEMGSAIQYPELARAFLEKHQFDTVIASVHYMRGHNDFYYWDMSDQNRESFERAFTLYLKDLEDTVDFGNSHVLAHLTYPIRYFAKAGKRYPIDFADKQLEALLKKVISKQMLLEVNSSGFTQGLDSPLPDAYVLGIYRELGGRLISIGSDAHSPDFIGKSYGLCSQYLKKCGFDRAHFIAGNEIFTCTI